MSLLTERYRFGFVADGQPLDPTAVPGVVARRGAPSRYPYVGTVDAIAALRARGRVVVDGEAVGIRDMAVTPDPEEQPTAPGLHEWVWGWLKPFQREAVARVSAFGGGYIHSAPGSGKTGMGIVWALSTPPRHPIVVVTRAGSRPTWEREAKRLTAISPWAAKAQADMRKADLELEAYLDASTVDRSRPFLILGYESLADWWPRLSTGLTRFRHRPVVVFDEIHKAKQFRRAKWIVDMRGRGRPSDLENVAATAAKLAAIAEQSLGLSATPIPNRVRDLWAQLDLLQPGAHGRFWDWAKRYCNAHQAEYGWQTEGTSNEDELRARVEAVTVSIPQAVSHAQLPAKRREVVFLAPSDQNAEATGMTRELKQAAKEERGADGGRATEIRLTLAASRKQRYVVREVAEAIAGGLKVLVFTNRRVLREKLTAAVRKAVPDGTPVWGVDGDDSIDAREEARAAYMAERKGCAFISTGDSMGEGVDLQDTDLFIVSMLPITPAQLRQWEDRVYRLGMAREVIVRYVIAEGTYDEHVSSILLDKLPAVDSLLRDDAMADAAEAIEGVAGHESELLDELFAVVTSAPLGVPWEPAWMDDNEPKEDDHEAV